MVTIYLETYEAKLLVDLAVLARDYYAAQSVNDEKLNKNVASIDEVINKVKPMVERG